MPNIFVGPKALLFGVVGSANAKARFELNLPPSRSSASRQSSVFAPFYPATFTSPIVASCDTKTPNTTTNTAGVTVSENSMQSLFLEGKRLPYSNSNSAD
jgi:hypothetical protein